VIRYGIPGFGLHAVRRLMPGFLKENLLLGLRPKPEKVGHRKK